jgi:NAD(P)-dependent dehydrogenase (short-subunit alcohol dehydrogenase family)
MAKDIQGKVVVITGASSGIGRAAALEFARHGAQLVVAARRESLLQDVARECQELSGHEALVVPTDVTDEQAVKMLARRAFERFGHIDVWINNAGVGAMGRFEDLPSEVYRRVIETNLFGTTYGARAVLPYFREQGHGVLINNASMAATSSGSYYSAYAASKFAIRALGESLRAEIEVLDGADIHICTVMPATIDTPFFRHAANYSGRAVRALPPVYPVEKVAQTMFQCAVRPQREVFVGNAGRMIGSLHGVAPALVEPMMARQIDTGHFKPEPSPDTQGNLFEPMQAGSDVSDGWKGQEKTNGRRVATLLVGAIAPAVIASVWLWTRRHNQ